MASKASDFVARFVRLSKKGRAMDMVPELKEMILEMGGVGFEISPQEETAMRLKPNKVFKKALALMDDKDAVAGLVSLIVPKDTTAKELYHIAMGVLLKLSCIPAFAKEFGEASPAPSFLLFQRFIFPKIQTGSRRRAAWEPVYVHAASLYIQMLLSLLQHSPRFTTDALESRLLHELLQAFPFPADPFLSWARTPDLQSVTLLALRQANTLVCLQENNPAGEKELRLDDLPLLGKWLDRFLGFLVALWGPLLACGEGNRIATAAAHALRFVDLAEGPERVNRVLFSKARRDALRQTAERLCALGPAYTTFGRQVIQTIERAGLSLVNLVKKEGKSSTAGARASVSKAESLMDRIQAAQGDDATWQLLEDLQVEVRKTGWGAKQTLRLAAKGCVSYLLNVLEKEDLTADRKGGAVAGTYQGPVWPALDTLGALAEPFSELNNDENKAFCQELANAAPRLLRFAQGPAADALGLLELRVLMDALFAACELNPDAKWDSRWALLDVLLAANERYDPVGPGAFSVWSHVYDHLPLIPEPSDETRGLISLLRMTPFGGPDKCETWAGLMRKMSHETGEQYTTWGPEAKKRELANVALAVLEDGRDGMADPSSPVPYAAAALAFFCMFREVISREVVQGIGPLMAALGAAYAGMATLARTCDSRPPDEEELQRWPMFEGVTARLCSCLDAVLNAEPLEGGLLDALALNGGVSFAAQVLRTRGEVGRYMRTYVPGGEDRSAALKLLEKLPGLALRLWEGLSKGYGLRKCSFQECPRDVLETRKGQFRKCSACGCVQYCSRECQASHWKREHKKTCKAKDGT